MSTANAQQVFTAQAVASMSPQHVAQLLQSKAATIATLEHRLAWFERQLFGKKSERFAPGTFTRMTVVGSSGKVIPS